MDAIANVAKVVGFQNTSEISAEGSGDARNAFLSDLPGAVFAALTLIYVISSLFALARQALTTRP